MGPQLMLERGEAVAPKRLLPDLTRCRRGLWSANPRDT
jgi:hypothetical protein